MEKDLAVEIFFESAIEVFVDSKCKKVEMIFHNFISKEDFFLHGLKQHLLLPISYLLSLILYLLALQDCGVDF